MIELPVIDGVIEQPPATGLKKPNWLRVKLPIGEAYFQLAPGMTLPVH